MNRPGKPVRDRRYTIRREWCGYLQRRYVVRFCGDWVGQREDRIAAAALMKAHQAKRHAELTTLGRITT